MKYLPALFTAIVWGSTFVASKSVLEAGVSSTTLMTFRFTIGLLFLLLFTIRDFIFYGWRAELYMVAIALSGGTIYFLFEYWALARTSAVNVGLITATVPISSAIITMILDKRRPSPLFVFGSILAFAGAWCVITRGEMTIEFFPAGDCLAIISSLLWSIYTVLVARFRKDIPNAVLTQRMFLYSLIAILPFTLANISLDEIRAFSSPNVLIPALYLAVFASGICLTLWNISIKKIGLVVSNNFLYLLPVVTFITSAIFASDEVSLPVSIATLMIFAGIIIADRNQ